MAREKVKVYIDPHVAKRLCEIVKDLDGMIRKNKQEIDPLGGVERRFNEQFLIKWVNLQAVLDKTLNVESQKEE